jgi:hypothetical protein
MASYKNQHFVPRCYLRAFSSNSSGRAINLFNVDRQIGIQNVSLKGQCARAYFYGKDLRVEKALRQFEEAYAHLLHRINSPPFSIGKSDSEFIRLFVYLQHIRTEATLQQMVVSMNETTDIAWNGEAPPDFRTTLKDAVVMAMGIFAETAGVVSDLKTCFLRNRTNRSFITSDNPAVSTNRWYAQNIRTKGLSGGLGNAGALLFLPLTPVVMAVVYDGDVYSIPNSGGWSIIERTADVDAFNEHQFLGCVANVYFSNWSELNGIKIGFQAAVPNRPERRHEIVVANLVEETAHGEIYKPVKLGELVREGKTLMHQRIITAKPSRWPSIIKWRLNPKIYYNGTGVGYVRRSTVENSPPTAPPFRRIR